MPKANRAVFSALLMASLVPLVAGCPDRTLSLVPLENSAEEKLLFDVNETRDVDILFVVDNSGSMEREQTSITEKFGEMIDTLTPISGELPSVHISVISTDLGGGAVGSVCGISGQGGRFQGQDCPQLSGPFLKSIVDDEGTRTENFTGSISDAFSCMATLGTLGCGFEQPLEAMRRALSAPQADEFLREHAFLAVIILTDEDDCSAKDTALFDARQQDLDSALGPPRSFRCFEFGVQCDQEGDLTRSHGPRSGCVPRDNSDYLYDVDEYVQFLYGLKRSPNQVLVATIAGELNPISVSPRRDEERDLDYVAVDYSCTRPDAEAVPPIRLSAFVQGFAPDHRKETSICEPDLSGALEDIAKLVNERASSCIAGSIADVDPAPGLQPDCVLSVSEPGEDEVRLPKCDNETSPQNSSNTPCFTLLENPACDTTPSGLSPKVHYAENAVIPVGATADVRCVAP